ncbi:Tm-1-like ATP-binding domain-containing protein [Ruegeria pomeroyi]|uniref:Tm-1-like ATP-binding domain-containing protein n=1 Tax=Ruegeria alba TaxID=2916756 RepID=A0ABS9P0W4_9RHOB|nr:Tm-1-like ATP-binding domain-containing protein [Ruegeria alba]MCE8514723.1 Tm-1-like ATP-binding domain-containing protein [Ruegeria pomeroyi]MCE8531443.1 Tm-1-like ATP-binding domain-containing protein [Ruegeria pomeroyi]MCE8535639.1 Tm-1-like ATP-binding domain-containing protein [Ruegeria pomeroyi]MCG6560130.1 Tm-1-like ATP-binding domain-containing protein [Ruegeria alba]
MSDKTILIAGTYDTKDDELNYLAGVIAAQGGDVLSMDVSVLGDPSRPTDVSKHEVAEAGGSSIQAAIDSGDENAAMQIMAAGAAAKALELYRAGRIHGVIVLGGTMGTDLALDLCAALPLGVPKYIVSTVSFSPLLPPERIPADVQMILWAGGLYGLNSICKASLSQAAGAVLGAARAVEAPHRDRPLIGMTSFGKTVLRYMVSLKPALEARGYEVAVFHATGMGGRAFESLAAEGAFAAVFDFAPQEVANHLYGGLSAGADRMTNAGRQGIPQLVAPGCYDLVDYVGWQAPPPALADRPNHAHNRLLTSAVLEADERRDVARAICGKLAGAKGPVALMLPTGGCNEWDRPGAPLHDADGLAAFCEEIRSTCPANADLVELDAHINDAAFSDRALAIFDDWMARGLVGKGA